MGETSIEWTATPLSDGTLAPGFTFNPWWGCEKISPACRGCYAQAFDRRVGGSNWGKDAPRKFFGDVHWAGPLKWDAKARKAGVRFKVFCASMADVFEDREDLVEPRRRLARLIWETPNLDWLLLTKRPENANQMIYEMWAPDALWPKNYWVGTTVENQKYADERIPRLLEIPVGVRFLSCEPLLGPVDLTHWLSARQCGYCGGWALKGSASPCLNCQRNAWRPGIAWCIGGGESGPKARPSHPDWFRSLRDQCRAAGVAWHFKQWGEWVSSAEIGFSGHESKPTQLLAPYEMMRVGKKAAGRSLDGVEHNEFPTVEVPHA